MNVNRVKNKLIKICFVAMFFNAYQITQLGTYAVTATTIALAALIIFGFMTLPAQIKNISLSFLASEFVFFIYIVISFLYAKSRPGGIMPSLNSVMLAIFFQVALLMSLRTGTWKQSENDVHFFHKIVNIAAGYGIYQVIGQPIGLPLVNPWINGHMVEGFNWTETGTTLISGIGLHRAHALFTEPSMFSQIIAINILIYLLYDKSGSSKWILLNIIALLASGSGTGMIVLAVGVICLILMGKIKLTSTTLETFGVLLIGFVLLQIFASDAIVSIFNRAQEIFGSGSVNTMQAGWTTSSGYVRFFGVWKICKLAMSQAPLLGIGPGTVDQFISSLALGIRLTSDNGFVRIIIEIGLLGLLSYLVTMTYLVKQINNNNKWFFVVIFILLHFLGNTFLLDTYWILLIFFSYSVDLNQKEDL